VEGTWGESTRGMCRFPWSGICTPGRFAWAR